MASETSLNSIRARAARMSIPINVMWEVTHRCPLACRHCYLGRRRSTGSDRELTTDEGRDFLAQAAGLGSLFMVFTGGEPLVRGDFFELVDEAKRLGFSWRLFTSGVLVDEERASIIAERMPLAVDVSLHGLAETHDAITAVPGSYDKALAAIRMLTDRGLRVIAKTSLTPGGLKDLSALRRICDEAGAALKVATSMFPDCDGRSVDAELCLSDDELREHLLRQEREFKCSFGRREALAADSPLCDAGRAGYVVSPGGDVSACLTVARVAGNLRQSSLADIWDAPVMKEYRDLRAGDRHQCRGCADEEFCRYCPGIAESETGDPLGAPRTTCREARLRHELYGRRANSASNRAGRS